LFRFFTLKHTTLSNCIVICRIVRDDISYFVDYVKLRAENGCVLVILVVEIYMKEYTILQLVISCLLSLVVSILFRLLALKRVEL